MGKRKSVSDYQNKLKNTWISDKHWWKMLNLLFTENDCSNYLKDKYFLPMYKTGTALNPISTVFI